MRSNVQISFLTFIALERILEVVLPQILIQILILLDLQGKPCQLHSELLVSSLRLATTHRKMLANHRSPFAGGKQLGIQQIELQGL